MVAAESPGGPGVSPEGNSLSEGWIRAVLFEHAIDDWIDLGPDPLRRRHGGAIYAEQVAACYSVWKWRTDEAGGDVNEPPEETTLPEALALAASASDWSGLTSALTTAVRAQSLLFREFAHSGGDTARRIFDKLAKDTAGHAALGYLELRTGAFVDQARAQEALGLLVPATRAWLEAIDSVLADRWWSRVEALLGPLGLLV